MANPVINPVLPFTGPIPGGAVHGRLIKIHGSPFPHATRFSINLQTGPTSHGQYRDDVALHIEVRFHHHTIIRNSYISHSWGHEEAHASHFPLAPGHPFEILILCEMHEYRIAMNGQHFAEFRHRLPLDRAVYLAVEGDLQLSLIQFEGGPSAPLPSIGVTPPYGAAPAYGVPHGAPPPYGVPHGAPPAYGVPHGAPPYVQAPPYPQQHSPHSSHKSGLSSSVPFLGGVGLGAGAAALGSQLLGHKKHGHGSSMPFLGKVGLGSGAAALGSQMLGHHGGHHSPKHSSAIPIGAGVLGTAAAVGGTYVVGKKAKKHMKKAFKHKHKHSHFHGHKSSSSSSSSSSD